MISCKKENHHNKSKSKSPNLDKKVLFKNWINSTGFTFDKVNDSTKRRAFELWAYFDKLEVQDSTLYWHPSIDSSYYLITNYNKERKIVSDSSGNVDLRFLKKGTNKVFIGFGFNKLKVPLDLDFYWYDENTFYFLTKYEKNYQLTKTKIEGDSLWSYGILNE